MERVRREKFLDNNARVLRAINTLRTQYVKIRDLEYGLEVEVSPAEIADSVNYLNEGGYIKLRARVSMSCFPRTANCSLPRWNRR